MYNVRFDTGGHTSAEVEGHVGTAIGHTDKTHDYKYSTLRTWMNDFYINKLGADSRILPTTVTYYTKDGYSENLSSFVAGTIANEYVFALDAKEASLYSLKFSWNNLNKQVNDDGSLSNNPSNYFWTTAGCLCIDGTLYIRIVRYGGALYGYFVDHSSIGARPVFWISLD